MRKLVTAALALVAWFILAIVGAAAPVVDSVDLGVSSWGLGADDFNRDGRLDFVNRGTDGAVYLFLNNGDGTFTKSTVATGILNDGGDIATGDFNSDGWPDIVYTNFSDTLYLQFNLHDGTFGADVVPTGHAELAGTECGDFNSDGLQDIFVIAYNSKTVLVLQGDGLGQFIAVGSFVADPDGVMTGGVPAVTSGDFNEDGWLDLVVGQDDDDRPGDAWFYAGDGSGQFTYVSLSYDTNPLESSGTDRAGGGRGDAYDFDGDGNLDIIEASACGRYDTTGAIAMFWGNGTPVFGAADTFLVRRQMNAVAAPPREFAGSETFGIGAGPFANWAVIVWFRQPAADSLIIPPVTFAGCDGETYLQPVQFKLTQPVKGATVAIKLIPDVQILDITRVGTATDGWNLCRDTIKSDSGYLWVLLANTSGSRIPVGTSTVFNIMLKAERRCGEDWYIHWDTAISVDPTRGTKFSDTLNHPFVPTVDQSDDSTAVTGFLVGDVTNDGTVDISDLSADVDYLFFNAPVCIEKALDMNGWCGIDIADLTYIIDYLFFSAEAPGCACTPQLAKIVGDGSVVTNARISESQTVITLTNPAACRGLYLELRGSGADKAINLDDADLETLASRVGDVLRVGLLDLNGGARIPAGKRAVLRLEGEYQIVRALVSDENHQTIQATIGAAGKESTLPTSFALSQNYPNPFNPNTQINFDLPVAARANLSIYNLLGQQVRVLVDGNLEAGSHLIEWDGRGSNGQPVASGVYLYRLEAGEFSQTRKMMLLK